MYIKYWLYTSRSKVEILHKNSNARSIKKRDYFYFQIHNLKFLYLAVYIAGLCPQCMDCPYIKSFDLFLVYIEYFWLMGSTLRCIDILFRILYSCCNGALFAMLYYNFSKIIHHCIMPVPMFVHPKLYFYM